MRMLFIDILAAYVLDLLFKDPEWLFHPVRFIGWLIVKIENPLLIFSCSKKRKKQKKTSVICGAVLCITVILLTGGIVYGLLETAKMAGAWLFHIVNIYFLYTSFAAGCLGKESTKIYKALKSNDIKKARKMISMLVSRDTKNLNEKGIIKASVETTAENTVDGIISPLFYAFAGSFFGFAAPLAYVLKAASTLDSMVGYKNEKYMYFGRVSARFDDILNYIPARISGILIPAASFMTGNGFLGSFKIMLRDRKKHKSPNSAYPEAAYAGSMGIQLGGSGMYFGKTVKKQTIGNKKREVCIEDIRKSVLLMHVTVFLFVIIIGILSCFIFK